jgi:uncharacterized SAM-binding protein YcdF (DUF218 family)
MRALNRLVAGAFTCCSLIGIAVLVVSFTPLVPSLAAKMATDWYQGNGDVLVVLGGSMLVPGTGPRSALGYDSYLRVVYASWVLQSAHYKCVITSGSDGLAENMAAYLTSHGVSPSIILLENRSHSTAENASYTKSLLEQHGIFKRGIVVAVLTSDYHSWRARQCFLKAGVPARAIPVPDILKRSASTPFRWTGLWMLVQEWMKDAGYRITGKL